MGAATVAPKPDGFWIKKSGESDVFEENKARIPGTGTGRCRVTAGTAGVPGCSASRWRRSLDRCDPRRGTEQGPAPQSGATLRASERGGCGEPA